MVVEMSKLSVEQRIQRAHVWLMKHPNYCLYSGIFMLGKTEVKDDVATAQTDGRNTSYGREFMSKLSEVEVRGVILHENLHKAFRHLSMWKHLYKENPTLSNMACDYVINQMIEDSDPSGMYVCLPKDALLDPKYRGWDSQTVYNDLKQQADNGGSVHVKTKGNPDGVDTRIRCA
jgi:predicted metal-dependent peptidase